MSKADYASVINLACFAAWVMVWLPCVVFLSKTWIARRDRLFAVFGPEEVRLYYKQFFPAVDISQDNSAQLRKRFADRYHTLYGKRRYFWPLLLAAFVAGIGAWSTAKTIEFWVEVSPTGLRLDPMAVMAFLGALTWVIYDQLQRLRSRDFTPHDVYNCVFRFLIAIPFGFALSKFANKDFGVSLAFLLGTFPTGTLFKYGRRLVNQQIKLGEADEGGTPELESLQGMGRTNAERFMDEGFVTIAELAWTDPVDLAMRTNFDFNYVVDCVSQALLWVYFEKSTERLYRLSLRGAQEAYTLVESLMSTDEKLLAAARETLAAAAAILGIQPQAAFYTLLKQVHDDPYTEFLTEIWR